MSTRTKWVLIVLAVIVVAIVALFLFNAPTRTELGRFFADSEPRHVPRLVHEG